MDTLTTPTTVVGGFDTEPDEFSDFDRLRTALPTSGSSTGEPALPAPTWPPHRCLRDPAPWVH